MFPIMNVPSDSLGWHWYIPAMIMAIVGSSVLLLTESDATKWRQAFAFGWLVAWMFIAVGFRFFLGWYYGL
ncbi:MAG: hypothetical protein WC802_02110 [Patescibacteria group bacterium]|jgi:hypothetical protein